MENNENVKVPLDIPADQRLYVTYALMSFSKHIKFAGDDFIIEAATQIPELGDYLNTTNELVNSTPKTEPYMLTPKELLAFFVTFDLTHKVMSGPEHFNMMMQFMDDEDETCVATFEDAQRNKELTFEVLEPFLAVMQRFADNNPEAFQIHQYLRIAKRLPLPGSKGVRQEYAPFDQPFTLPESNPTFLLSKYHNSGINIILLRNILVDMNFHLIFPLVKTIIEMPDNLPSRIITAYFPDFRHYFLHMVENLKLLQGTNEQLSDLEEIKKSAVKQELPEVIFGSIYLAFDFALKMSFSDKGYTNYPALMMDRFGLFGEKMFGQFAAENAMDEAFQKFMPILTDYFGFLTDELDHNGSTLVADYKAFAQQVTWWD